MGQWCMNSVQQSYSDHPTIHDELGFAPTTEALLSIINGLALEDTPLTIGIFGPWGSGKTSQMHMILDRLDTNQCIPIWFDAWRYAQTDALWRALLLSVVEEIRAYVLNDDDRLRSILERKHRMSPDAQCTLSPETIQNESKTFTTYLDDMVGSLYRSIEREETGGIEVNWGEAGKVATRVAIRLGFSSLPLLGVLTNTFEKAIEKAQETLGEGEDAAALFDVFQRTRSQIYRDHVRSLEQFYQQLKCLVNEWIIASNLRLVVFIDDLDRCLPEQAIGVLEALKVFLDIRGCIFLLGVDREVIERGIGVRYKEFTLANTQADTDTFPIAGRDYLDKIIQIPFELPPLEHTVIQKFVTQRLQQQAGLSEEEIKSIAYIMANGLQPNPRKVKRTLNTFRLLRELGRLLERTPQPTLLAKLVVIQSSFPHVYEQVVLDPSVLKLLEEVASGHVQMHNAQAIQKLFLSLFPQSYDHIIKTSEGMMLSNWTDVLTHAAYRLKNMLSVPPFFSLNDDELRNLVFLTRRTV
jgi:hypothetical protein